MRRSRRVVRVAVELAAAAAAESRSTARPAGRPAGPRDDRDAVIRVQPQSRQRS